VTSKTSEDLLYAAAEITKVAKCAADFSRQQKDSVTYNTTWRCIASFTLRSLQPRKGTLCTYRLGSCAGFRDSPITMTVRWIQSCYTTQKLITILPTYLTKFMYLRLSCKYFNRSGIQYTVYSLHFTESENSCHILNSNYFVPYSEPKGGSSQLHSVPFWQLIKYYSLTYL
jgi:hypothetical protein